jgi:homoserine kinase type II
MAVYTEVSDDELVEFAAEYDVGQVTSCKGIAEGVENTNYLVGTETGNYILTLYEKRVKREDLPFFLGLMEHLAAKGLPAPTPLRGRDGRMQRELCGRPAALATFLEGMWPRRISVAHCAGVGEMVARMHLAGVDFALRRANDLSLPAWRPLLAASLDHADEVQPDLAAFLESELTFLESAWPLPEALPGGVVHADLFPDNVFFRGDQLTGMIDFYFACNDFFTYDLAICINAWCFERDGDFNATKARRMLAGYRRVREFTAAELAALPLMARGSALRFLLTRLYDWVHTPANALVTPKDPLEYVYKLRFHQGVGGPGAYGLE